MQRCSQLPLLSCASGPLRTKAGGVWIQAQVQAGGLQAALTVEAWTVQRYCPTVQAELTVEAWTVWRYCPTAMTVEHGAVQGALTVGALTV